MLNKLLTAVGGFGFVLILLFGSDFVSYVTTSARHVQSAVRETIPLDFEIQRAKSMIHDLTPTIRESMVSVAREDIELARLGEQIEELESAQATAKHQLIDLQAKLENEEFATKVEFAKYTPAELGRLAENSLQRYQTRDRTLRSLKDARDVRARRLATARTKLDSIIAARDQLTLEIASLEARKNMNAVTSVAAELEGSVFDESALTRTRELVREIETRIQVEERLAATEHRVMEEVMPVVGVPSDRHADIAQRISRCLAKDDELEKGVAMQLMDFASSKTPAVGVTN